MKYCDDRRIQKIVAALVKEGWTYRRGRVHPKVTSPSGASVTFSWSPSCRYAADNMLGDVKRIKARESSGVKQGTP